MRMGTADVAAVREWGSTPLLTLATDEGGNNPFYTSNVYDETVEKVSS